MNQKLAWYMKPCIKISITTINKWMNIWNWWDIRCITCSASASNKDVQVNSLLELQSEKMGLPSMLTGKLPKVFELGVFVREWKGGVQWRLGCAHSQAALRSHQSSVSTVCLQGKAASPHLSTLSSFGFHCNWWRGVLALILVRWERFFRGIYMF